MSFQVLVKNRAKRELIREIAAAWIAVSPVEAKEAAQQLKKLYASQYRKNGGYRKGVRDQYGYVKVRIPSTLFHLLRKFIPGFLDDDADLRMLCREFPDLIPCNIDT